MWYLFRSGEKAVIWQTQEADRGSSAQPGKSEGKRDCERPLDAGSHSYVHKLLHRSTRCRM